MKLLFLRAILVSLLSLSLFCGCGSSSLTNSNFVQVGGPPLQSLGLKKVSPSEVVVRELPYSTLRSNTVMNNWGAERMNQGLIPIGSSNYQSQYAPNIDDIRETAAKHGAQFVYTRTDYSGQGTRTVQVPVLSTSGRTITTNTNVYGSVANSTSYVPGSTVYAPKTQAYNVYTTYNLFFASKSAMPRTSADRLIEHRRLSSQN